MAKNIFIVSGRQSRRVTYSDGNGPRLPRFRFILSVTFSFPTILGFRHERVADYAGAVVDLGEQFDFLARSIKRHSFSVRIFRF